MKSAIDWAVMIEAAAECSELGPQDLEKAVKTIQIDALKHAADLVRNQAIGAPTTQQLDRVYNSAVKLCRHAITKAITELEKSQ